MAKKILIIDDSPDILAVTKVRLQVAGYEVVVSESGEDALTLLKQNIPDLILLDLLLPDIQGEDFCKQLKADPKFKHIPIIVFTAKVIKISETIKQIGADDYVIKPFEPDDLLQKIKKYAG